MKPINTNDFLRNRPNFPTWPPKPMPPLSQPPVPPRRPTVEPIHTYPLDVMNFTRRDGDQNGYLSSDEYGTGQRAQKEFARYDTNHDGKLTLDEYRAGKERDRGFRDIKTQLKDKLGKRPPVPAEHQA